MRDVLPDVPGLAELWGSVVAHGPFCHGHEFAGGTVVVQGASDTRAVVVVDDGPDIVVDGFFVRSAFEQSAPFAETLGLELLPSGCVAVDSFGHQPAGCVRGR